MDAARAVVVAVRPVGEVAPRRGDARAGRLRDATRALEQNGGAGLRAAQIGIDVDIAAVHRHGSIHVEGAIEVQRSGVARGAKLKARRHGAAGIEPVGVDGAPEGAAVDVRADDDAARGRDDGAAATDPVEVPCPNGDVSAAGVDRSTGVGRQPVIAETHAGPNKDLAAGGVDGAVPIDRVVVGVDAAHGRAVGHRDA